MRPGMISQTAYRRSVLKKLHKDSGTLLFAPSREERCYGIHRPEGTEILQSQAAVCGKETDLAVYALARTANALASRGAKPMAASVELLLPEWAEEEKLAAMMEALAGAAEAQGIALGGIEAQTVPHMELISAVVHCTGTVEGAVGRRSCTAQADQDLVLLKWVGLEGMLRICQEKRAELEQRFPGSFLKRLESYRGEIFSAEAIAYAAARGASAIHPVDDGGIFAALWELAESSGLGLQADLKKISILQETVEVCERFHLNPYLAAGTGSVLLAAENGGEMADALKREGVCAAVIGRTQKKKERILVNGEEKRYLDRPAPDELYYIY